MKFTSQQSQLSSLIANLPATIYQCRNDKQWTMSYISENCWQLTGYKVEDIIQNKNISYGSLIDIRDQEFVWEEIQAAITSGTEFNLDYRIVHKSGKIKWVWERGKGIYSQKTGKLLALEGFIVDVTRKKSIEQEQSLLLSLTKAISSAINFETALIYTLQKICTIGNWDFGEAWLPSLDKKLFTYCTAWFPRIKNHSSEQEVS